MNERKRQANRIIRELNEMYIFEEYAEFDKRVNAAVKKIAKLYNMNKQRMADKLGMRFGWEW